MTWVDAYPYGCLGKVFPVSISYDATGGPEFLTEVVQLDSGWSATGQTWAESSGRWSIAKDIIDEGEWQSLLAFFLASMGRGFWFWMRDWSDYKSADSEAIDVSRGANPGGTLGDLGTPYWLYQIVKNYTSGDQTFRRKIGGLLKLADDFLHVYVNGSEVPHGPTGYQIYDDRGLIYFPNGHEPAANAVITASFQFVVPVRFDKDEMRASLTQFESYLWGEISLVGVDIWQR